MFLLAAFLTNKDNNTIITKTLQKQHSALHCDLVFAVEVIRRGSQGYFTKDGARGRVGYCREGVDNSMIRRTPLGLL